MTDGSRGRFRSFLLMVFVGLPSLVAGVLGGVGVIASLSVEDSWTLGGYSLAWLVGGIAGLWGSQSLSEGRDSMLARGSALLGVTCFMVMVATVWRTE